jgi:glycosyltransferase involved in cell wall biosynthesis
MVILEAMAAGVPVVATRVPGVVEAIRDGLDGRLARPGDAGELAAAIESYFRDPLAWSRIRARAHRRQAEQFSDRSMARGVAEVYGQVLRK